MARASTSPWFEFDNCARLTFRNWLLAVPTFAVALLACAPILLYGIFGDDPSILGAIFSGGRDGTSTDTTASNTLGFLASCAISAVVAVVLGIIAIGATYAGAGDVLRGLPVDLRGIVRRGAARFGQILLFGLIVAGVGIAFELVVGELIALSGFALGFILIPLVFCAAAVGTFFLMYAVPAIVLGGLNAGDAIGQSFDLALENADTTATVMLCLIVLDGCVWVTTLLLQYVPIAGQFAMLAIYGLSAVFQALVVSKFYLNFMSSASPPMPDSQV